MSPPELPAPAGTPYRIGLVCLGNICRSPMADVVLTALLDRVGRSAEVEVSSSGTGGWYVGRPMDPRAAATLVAGGYDPSRHRARQLDGGWVEHDLILAMDADNLDEVCVRLGVEPDGRIRLFRDFDPVGTGDVPDPYYGGPDGFEEVLAMVERTAGAIVGELERG